MPKRKRGKEASFPKAYVKKNAIEKICDRV